MTSSIFNIGTVSAENGSAVVTGDGTAWAINGVSGGMFSCGGMAVPIASVENDTSLTLAYAWPGSNVTGATYAIAMETAQAAETIWASRHWARIVGQALLAGIVPVASGTLAERDALDPQPANGEWFAHAEPPHDLTFYRKTPGGWEGPYQVRGAAGDRGPIGSGFVLAGEWDNGSTYSTGNLVWFGERSFASLHDDNTGNEPPSADEDDAHWQFVPAAVGPQGDPGPEGDPGVDGAPGESIAPQGDYSGATAYATRDVVTDQGSSWIALQPTTGNAPPTLPATSNDYWMLMALRGEGDISGPVSSTDGAVALWDGTGGDALKDGPVLGTAAGKDTGTSGDAVPLLNGNNVWDGSTRFNNAFGIGTAGIAIGGMYFHRTSGDAPFLLFSYGDPNAPTNIGQFRGSGGGGILGITGPTGSPYGIAYNTSLGRVGIMTNAPAHTLSVNGVAAPLTDNSFTLGASGYRWSVVWAATGTISTSDARDKEVVARIGGWAADLVDAVEPALYRWLVGGNDVVQVEDGYDEEEQYVFEDASDLVEEVAIEDGRAVVRVVERTVKRQVFDEYPVVDAAGEPVMVDGRQAVHRVPRVEVVQIPRYRDEAVPVAGQRLHAGWLAQEVKTALDAAGIDCGAWGLDDAADPESRQWVRPDQMVAIMWAALRETRRDLAELRAQVEG